MGKGILTTSKLDEIEGFQSLGHSNWTIGSPLSHFWFQIFATIYYLGGQIMGNGKGSISQL